MSAKPSGLKVMPTKWKFGSKPWIWSGILDVVVGRAVAVVVGVVAGGGSRRAVFAVAPPAGSGLLHRMSVAELQAVRRSCPAASAARCRGSPDRHAILPRAHVDLSDHAHLQVLGRSDVAVPEVGAGIRRQVVVGEAAADVDGDRGIRHAVVERRSVRIAVEVDRVLLEQVRAHDHADVGQRQEELVVLVDRHQRRRDVAVHHADVHDLARIDVTVDARRDAGGRGLRIR